MGTAEPLPLLAGVELGGTKCICILGTGPSDIRAQVELPTGTPASTLQAIAGVLDDWRARSLDFTAIGLAAFGPLNLRSDSPRFGWIARTVKPGWSDTELVGHFARRYRVPIGIDTDVNGAARAEGRWGGARDLNDFAYVTVGTGIGAGVIINGRSIAGANHTEVGHIRIARLAQDEFAGVCPFHGDCLEGLASGPAIAARARRDPAQLAPDDPIWGYVAHALAQLCQTVVLTSGPRRIFLGGGVMVGQPQLFALIREHLQRSLNGYLANDEIGCDIDRFIVPPVLGAAVGPLGALAVAAAKMVKEL
ncbi:MAG TPA: ROK family protein [Steroidobacteraceae bacterium]|jgi:fructokinase|nr:ROK family protein [Steroidobacteraceae bacterium]